MTDPTMETSTARTPVEKPRTTWPDDPTDMMHEMMREQSSSLHAMFYDLKRVAALTFPDWPQEAQAYFRLALRAQANCRSALETVARADRAARRSVEESKK